jgi:tetratricopeptide (TPR) repeat protein
MKKSMVLMAVLGMVLALSVPYASARATQDPSPEELAAYKAWYDATTAKDWPKVYQLGKEFIAKYPGKNAETVKKYIPGARGVLFNQAIQAKNMEEAIRLGKEALAENPEDINYLYILAYNLRTNEIFATPPNFNRAADTTDFTQRTVKLIESGKMPAGVTADKKNAVLATFYQTLAVLEAKNNNADKALEYYKKSTSTDPANTSLNAYSYLACGSLNQAKYQAAAKKFEELPTEKKTNPEDADYKAALEVVNTQADAVLDCWAHFLALEESKSYGATRANVEKAFMDLWKFRHDDKADGAQEFINKFKPGAAPSGTPTSAPAKP